MLSHGCRSNPTERITMHVPELTLEVTRRCNLKCVHCLRGCAQRMDMPSNVVYHTFRKIEGCKNLTLTGGEPSMACEVIEDIYQNITMNGFRFEYFYVVTNAATMRNRQRFMNILYKLYQWADDSEACVLCVSQDQYHRCERGTPNLKYYDEMKVEEYGESYCREHPFFKPDERKRDIIRVINDGRAVQTQMGTEGPKGGKPWIVDENLNIQERTVYISANGNITSSSNMSFRRIDKLAFGNITTDCLEDVIRTYSAQEEIYA